MGEGRCDRSPVLASMAPVRIRVNLLARGLNLVAVLPEIQDSRANWWMNGITTPHFVGNAKQDFSRFGVNEIHQLLDLLFVQFNMTWSIDQKFPVNPRHGHQFL